jgi:outer membrane protein OmpA-like peptidoglycan-associated protein
MRRLRVEWFFGAALAAIATVSGSSAQAADAPQTSGSGGGSTGASAVCAAPTPAPETSKEDELLESYHLGLDGVGGAAQTATVNNVVPPGSTAGIFGKTTVQNASITNYSVIADAGLRLTPGFGLGLRLPIMGGTLFAGPTRSDVTVGNLEVSAVGMVNLAKSLNLELTLGVTLPTGGGDQIPPNAAAVPPILGGVDQSGFDRQSIQRAVSFSRGLEEDEFFQVNHLGINPKIRLIVGTYGKWHIDPWVKLDNLIATNSSYPFIDELLFGVNIGGYIVPAVEPVLRVWANVPLTGTDYDNPVAVVEPRLRFHIGDFTPYAGVILPFAGPISNPYYDWGVRIGLSVSGFPEPPPPPADKDGDCIPDTEDACPSTPGIRTDDPKTNGCPPPPSDRDKDGIADSEDACPDTAGVKTDDPKTNGCPSDKDKDGIIDSEDACPDQAGPKTDDPKTNGCPPPADKDKDGVADNVDACPDVPGVATEDPKTNGCPADTDGDGILDAEDACPKDAGPKDPDPKKNGCPIARVEGGQVKISSQIKFKTGSAVILKESQPIIDAVAAIMKAHTEIAHVQVEGHTDNKGSAQGNLTLSKKRAASVLAALVAVGIEKTRLSSEGFGQEKPIDSNSTDDGRANNRRVEFHIQGEK